MTTRSPDRTLVLVVDEGATGTPAPSSLDPALLLDHLAHEFDVLVLDGDGDGDLQVRRRVRDDDGAPTDEVLAVPTHVSGDLPEALSKVFDGDLPDIVHVKSGASPVYKLVDAIRELDARVVVSVDGHTDALSARRIWSDRLDQVDLWVFDATASLDWFDEPDPMLEPGRAAVIEPWSDQSRRGDVHDGDLAWVGPLRFGIVATRSPQSALVRAERLAGLLPPEIEVHVFGAPPGASRSSVHCHAPVPVELLPDVFVKVGVQIVETGTTRYASAAELAARLAGVAVCAPVVGASAQRARADATGWLVDPADLCSIAELLELLDAHRFEVDRALRASRDVPIQSGDSYAARLAEHYRRLVREP